MTALPQNVNDLTGKRFGRLVARTFHDTISTGARWICNCDCGNTSIVTANNLRAKQTISCGCYRRETTSKRFRVHGKRWTREYNVWLCAKNRCFNPRCKTYPDYGGRGIQMCDEWKHSFNAFLEHMGKCPEGMTLDRINNDGNYEPANCRWTTVQTQNNNQRRTRMITHNGETLPMSVWAAKLGIPYQTLQTRLHKGRKLIP